MRIRIVAILVLAWSLGATPALAQVGSAEADSASAVASNTPGVLKGTVVSGETGQPLAYTNIVVYPVDERGRRAKPGGTMALNGGFFVHRVAPGTYDLSFLYIGYERLVLTDVVVEPGQELALDVTLKVQPIEMAQLVVQAAAIEDTEMSQLRRRQDAMAMTDAISAEQISKGTDSDASEVLERVTGISVVGGSNGGKYVFVRGLGDRYSQTQLNGAPLSSPEPNRKAVPMDVFPAGLLENIVVQKTYTPDMEGEFGGGVVNLNTRDWVGGSELKTKIGVGANTNVLDHGFKDYQGGGLDFLGFDDGARGLPGAVPDGRPLQRGRLEGQFTTEELRDLRKSFSNVWLPRDEGARPNASTSLQGARDFTLFGRDLGVLGAFTLSNSHATVRDKEDNEYRNDTEGRPLRAYRVDESRFSALAGLTGALTYQLSGDDVLKYNVLVTRNADDVASFSHGFNDDYGADVTQYRLGFVEKGLDSNVLTGRHGFFWNSTVDWVGSYSHATYNEPDRRRVVYETPAGSDIPSLSGREAYPFTRVFGASDEYDRSGKLSLSMPLHQGGSGETSLKVGVAHRSRDRNSGYRRFGIRCRGRLCPEVDLTRDPESILAPGDTLSTDFLVEETTRANDSWSAEQEIDAAYAMLDLRIRRFRMVGGLRLERVRTKLVSGSPYATATSDEGVDLHREYEDGLPALNLTYRLTERQSLRAGYSKTLNRPELRELSPFSIYNYEDNLDESGNPDVRQARLHSYDVRYEFYPSLTQLVSVGVFYKDLRHPIEYQVEGGTGQVTRSPVNGDAGILRGVEVELRTTARDLFRTLMLRRWNPPPALGRLGIAANHSRIFSEVYIPRGEFTRHTSLTGQSDTTTNLGLSWESGRWDLSLQYKHFGPRLFGVGLGELPDVYEYPGSSTDLAAGVGLGRTLSLKFTAENLADTPVERLQGDAIFQRSTTGRKFGLSISMTR